MYDFSDWGQAKLELQRKTTYLIKIAHGCSQIDWLHQYWSDYNDFPTSLWPLTTARCRLHGFHGSERSGLLLWDVSDWFSCSQLLFSPSALLLRGSSGLFILPWSVCIAVWLMQLQISCLNEDKILVRHVRQADLPSSPNWSSMMCYRQTSVCSTYKLVAGCQLTSVNVLLLRWWGSHGWKGS